MTLEEYQACDDRPGYISEIIDGVVHVSPSAKPNHDIWQNLVYDHLRDFARKCPQAINYVTGDNDVVIPIRPGPTRPRPDVTAYRGFSRSNVLIDSPDWADFCPVLVVEIISPRRRRKDTVRNRQLYWSAGGIAEYWIIDLRRDAGRPTLIALSRSLGQPDWTEVTIAFGESYQSRTMPDLTINLKTLLEQA